MQHPSLPMVLHGVVPSTTGAQPWQYMKGASRTTHKAADILRRRWRAICCYFRSTFSVLHARPKVLTLNPKTVPSPLATTERERELFIQEGNRAPVAKATQHNSNKHHHLVRRHLEPAPPGKALTTKPNTQKQTRKELKCLTAPAVVSGGRCATDNLHTCANGPNQCVCGGGGGGGG